MPSKHPRAQPICIGGVTYPSMQSAAESLGVSRKEIAKLRDNPDHKLRPPPPNSGHHKVPVRIRGVDYPSITAAARALGVTKRTVNYALDHGYLETCGVVKRRRGAKGLPITIDGVTYPTMSAAYAQSGLSRRYIDKLKKEGKLK